MRLRALITLLLLSLGSALALGPASATGSTYIVSVGGSSTSGGHLLTATTAGPVVWKVPTLTWGCAMANIPTSPASVVTSGPAVTDVAHVAKLNVLGCTWPGGALGVTSVGSWKLHGVSPATSGSDVIKVHLENITINMSNAVCTFTVAGRMDGLLDEATQQLKLDESGFTGNLKVFNVVGCLGQVHNGQYMDFKGTLNLTTSHGSIDLN